MDNNDNNIVNSQNDIKKTANAGSFLRKMIILSVCVLLCISVVVFSSFYIVRKIKNPYYTGISKTREFTVNAGDSVKKIAENLEIQKFIENKHFFIIYAVINKKQAGMKAGRYSFVPNMSVAEIADDIINGKVIPDEISITFPEGLTLDETENIFRNNGYNIDLKSLRVADFNPKYDFLKDAPPNASLEGFLFPDTYNFFTGEKDEKKLVSKMLDNFEKKIGEYLKNRAPDQNETVYNTVIMASLIEREVITDEDKKIASGLLWKRIEIGMPLQVDATIIYIKHKRGDNGFDIYQEDLSIDSPYNTYLNLGLPPAPISNPGLGSLVAAIHPQQSDYLYYLSKPDGTTVFSENYKDHLRAKNLYLR